MINCYKCLRYFYKNEKKSDNIEFYDVNNMEDISINSIDVLKNSTNNSIPDFSLCGLHTLCKVVDIYDADTFRVIFFKHKDDKEPIKLKVRAEGCNAAEMYPLKSHPNRKEEMRRARLARNRLVQIIISPDVKIDVDNIEYTNSEISEMLSNNKKLVYIKFGKFDKYGRVLGTLYLDENKDNSINQMLIDENHAVSYSGGKRKKNKLTVSG